MDLFPAAGNGCSQVNVGFKSSTAAPIPRRPGEICGHTFVIACLPVGVYSTSSAPSVAKDMLSTYKTMRFGLMVSISGRVPSQENDIRLGNVVVSKPVGPSGGVVQYDYGKTMAGGKFGQTGTSNKPPAVVLTVLCNVQSEEMLGRSRLNSYLSAVIAEYPPLSRFTYPGEDQGLLFKADYTHDISTLSCGLCDMNMTIQRTKRPTTEPNVFYDLIASANQVMKDAITRDRIARQHGVLCFEMEAARLWINTYPRHLRLFRFTQNEAKARVCGSNSRGICKESVAHDIWRIYSPPCRCQDTASGPSHLYRAGPFAYYR
ncbi:hypothetical protein BDV38DRAFT_279261 [Aspergillus pseudotamarii]|uniref:Nucleoside phosphorylase domain-containing protein n=1 Tax=Aspergillus pseudotamarii TaxID=132259 RepID=A0A5N6T4Z3_ASPPS|nr:uncharacterized protein BDV38DRAFT_279261 [Aspergillus pseudotamarii]KAE8141360.1 hypothetical protein BDV38DRAFT_279261 [Aspergillus pseudotamarii]